MTVSAGTSLVHVRPLRPDDRGDWGLLWEGYLRFYETERPRRIFDLTFGRLTDPEIPDMFGLVAEQDGQLSGLAHVILHDHCWHVSKVAYLQDLFTAPDLRGAGIGRALIEAVYEAADARGAAGTYWLTQEFNQTARKLYDRVGQVSPFIKYQRA